MRSRICNASGVRSPRPAEYEYRFVEYEYRFAEYENRCTEYRCTKYLFAE